MRLLLLILIFSIHTVWAQVSLNYDSIGSWREVDFPLDGKNNTYNEVWGYTKDSLEYAVIGSRKGTHFLNVTDPSNIEQIKFIPGRYSDATHRDYHDFRGYLYMVCDQSHSSVQIVNLNYLPDSISLVYDSDELLNTTHNIFIDTIGEKLYACSVNDSDGTHYDLKIFDLSQSFIPKTLVEYNDRFDDIDAFHDIWVRNDTGIGNNGNTGLFFYDFHLPDTVILFSSLVGYSQKGYNHSGYATEDNRYYYFADENHGKALKALDIRNLEDPTEVDLFNSGRNIDQTIPHNLIVHDTMLYVSYYHEGLQVFNISDPADPVKSGHYHTYTSTLPSIPGEEPEIDYSGYKGAWGVYPFLPSGNILLSDREKGLFVFKLKRKLTAYEKHVGYKAIYPNPFIEYFYITYKFERIVKLKIFDLNGKLLENDVSYVKDKDLTKVIPSVDLSVGIYLLEVEGLTEKFTLKISKKKPIE